MRELQVKLTAERARSEYLDVQVAEMRAVLEASAQESQSELSRCVISHTSSTSILTPSSSHAARGKQIEQLKTQIAHLKSALAEKTALSAQTRGYQSHRTDAVGIISAHSDIGEAPRSVVLPAPHSISWGSASLSNTQDFNAFPAAKLHIGARLKKMQ